MNRKRAAAESPRGKPDRSARRIFKWFVGISCALLTTGMYFQWRRERSAIHLDVRWPIQQRTAESKLFIDGREVPLIDDETMRYRIARTSTSITAKRRGYEDAVAAISTEDAKNTFWQPEWKASAQQRLSDQIETVSADLVANRSLPAFHPAWRDARRQIERLSWSPLTVDQRSEVQRIRSQIPSPMTSRLRDDGNDVARVKATTVLGQRLDWRIGSSRLHHADAITHLQFSADSKTILSVSRDAEMRISSTADGRTLHRGWLPAGTAECAAATDGLDGVAVGGSDGRVYWWQPDTESVTALHPPHGRVRTLAVSPDGRHLLSGGSDLKLRLWRLKTDAEDGSATLEHAWTLSHHVIATAWSRNSTLFAAADSNGIGLVVRTSDHATLRLVEGPPQRHLFFDETEHLFDETEHETPVTKIVGLGPNYQRAVWSIPATSSWPSHRVDIRPDEKGFIPVPLGSDPMGRSFWSAEQSESESFVLRRQPILIDDDDTNQTWTLATDQAWRRTDEIMTSVIGPTDSERVAIGTDRGSIVIASVAEPTLPNGPERILAPEIRPSTLDERAIDVAVSSGGDRWAVLWANGDVAIYDAFDRVRSLDLVTAESSATGPTQADARLFDAGLGWTQNDQTLASFHEGILSIWDLSDGSEAATTYRADRLLGIQPIGDSLFFARDNEVRQLRFGASEAQRTLIDRPNLAPVHFQVHPAEEMIASFGDDRFLQITTLSGQVQRRLELAVQAADLVQTEDSQTEPLLGNELQEGRPGNGPAKSSRRDIRWVNHDRVLVGDQNRVWAWNPWSQLQPAFTPLTIPKNSTALRGESIGYFQLDGEWWRTRGGHVHRIQEEASRDEDGSTGLFGGTTNGRVRFVVHPDGRTLAVCDAAGQIDFYVR